MSAGSPRSVTTKTCIKCGEAKALDAFSRNSATPDGLRYECRPCDAIRNRQYKLNQRRKCTSCRRKLADNEAPGKCDGCKVRLRLSKMSQSLPEMLGRPGCIIAGGVCQVLDEPGERWVEMPVVNCKTCGLDQHLDECLDCTAPVGQGDKQKSVRPLRHCVDCGDWTPNSRCAMCTV